MERKEVTRTASACVHPAAAKYGTITRRARAREERKEGGRDEEEGERGNEMRCAIKDKVQKESRWDLLQNWIGSD